MEIDRIEALSRTPRAFPVLDARSAAAAIAVTPTRSIRGPVTSRTRSNAPHEASLDANGRMLAPEVLRPRFEALLAGHSPQRGDRSYCGSGVTACHLMLAMDHAGLPGARRSTSAASPSGRARSRPVATGTGT